MVAVLCILLSKYYPKLKFIGDKLSIYSCIIYIIYLKSVSVGVVLVDFNRFEGRSEVCWLNVDKDSVSIPWSSSNEMSTQQNTSFWASSFFNSSFPARQAFSGRVLSFGKYFLRQEEKPIAFLLLNLLQSSLSLLQLPVSGVSPSPLSLSLRYRTALIRPDTLIVLEMSRPLHSLRDTEDQESWALLL